MNSPPRDRKRSNPPRPITSALLTNENNTNLDQNLSSLPKEPHLGYQEPGKLDGKDKEEKSIWTPKVISYTLLFIITGTGGTLSMKLQDSHNFKHGLVQTLFMCVGEALSSFYFYFEMVSFSSQI